MTEKSPEFIRANLVNYTNANCSESEVKNNRYHYHLKFEEDIGWDWLEQQVNKCAEEMETRLEPWKIRGSGMEAFELEVREVARRRGIDDDQYGLTDFGDAE